MAALLDGRQRYSPGQTRPALKAGAGCAFQRSCRVAADAASAAEGKNGNRYAGEPFTVRDVAGYACAHKKAALKAQVNDLIHTGKPAYQAKLCL